jgi:hypothetical protein
MFRRPWGWIVVHLPVGLDCGPPTCGAGLWSSYLWCWTVVRLLVGLDCGTPTCECGTPTCVDGLWHTYLWSWTVVHLPVGLDCGTPTCGAGLWHTYLWGWTVVHLPVGLDYDSVEVLDPVHNIRGHCVTGPQRQLVHNHTLKRKIFCELF